MRVTDDPRGSMVLLFLGGAPTSNGSFFCLLAGPLARWFVSPDFSDIHNISISYSHYFSL